MALSDLRLQLIQQRFVSDSRPLWNSRDVCSLGFVMFPEQEININSKVLISDREYKKGGLLYVLNVIFKDQNNSNKELEVFWWYGFDEDKFWNNLTK